MNTTIQEYLTVNGKQRSFEASLLSVLSDFGIDVSQARGVAVAVNDEVVRKTKWSTFELSPEDRVEIVTARQGG